MDKKYKYDNGEITFYWDTAKELGELVAKSGVFFPNPFCPSSTDFDDFIDSYRENK